MGWESSIETVVITDAWIRVAEKKLPWTVRLAFLLLCDYYVIWVFASERIPSFGKSPGRGTVVDGGGGHDRRTVDDNSNRQQLQPFGVVYTAVCKEAIRSCFGDPPKHKPTTTKHKLWLCFDCSIQFNSIQHHILLDSTLTSSRRRLFYPFFGLPTSTSQPVSFQSTAP